MSSCNVVVVRTAERLIVSAPGPQGIQGPAGPSGGYTPYEYVQSVPAATWIINHNLGRKVHVSLFDSGAELVFADVEHGSLNQTTVTFPGPAVGSALIS